MIPENRPPTHPGEMLLEEFLQPLGMTQSEAARRMEIPLNRLNEVIRGRRGITADTALRLAKLLNTEPEIWMNLQNQWDLWHAARAEVHPRLVMPLTPGPDSRIGVRYRTSPATARVAERRRRHGRQRYPLLQGPCR